MSELQSTFSPVCEGMMIRRAANGFAVVRLHYTAHPARRTKEWKEAESKKYEPHAWEQEQELNWASRAGEKVFPNFSLQVHCIDPFEVPSEAPMAMVVDPGYRNYLAACFYVLDAEDNIYQVGEIYARKLFVPQAAAAMKAKAREFGRRVADMNWLYVDKEAKSERHGQPRSILDQYKDEGISFQLAPQVKDVHGHNLIRTMLHNALEESEGRPKTGPAFYVFKECVNTILEFQQLSFMDKSNDLNQPEKAKDKNNHTVDCLKNFTSTNPKYSIAFRDTELTKRIWDINKETHRRLTQ